VSNNETTPDDLEQEKILAGMDQPEPEDKEVTVEDKKSKKKKASNSASPVTLTGQNTTCDIGQIDLPEHWNREKAGDLKLLIQSIKVKGQLVPLAVRVNPENPGRYILVDGRRRYMAMLDLGLKQVNISFVADDNDVDAYMSSMATNLAREGHNSVEIAESFAFLIENGKKQKEIAAGCGRSESYVSQHIGILELPPEILKLVRLDKLNFAHLRVFKRVFNDNDMSFFTKLTEKVIKNNLSPDVADEAVSQYLERKRQKEEAAGKKSKKTGRPNKKSKTNTLDYDELSSSIKPLPKKEIVALLKEYSDRYAGSGSKGRAAYYEGFLHGAETTAGLRATE